MSFKMGHGKNCRCKTRERSKGPKRLRKKRDNRCESAFTCNDDKLRPPSAESSIAGACCSSSSGGSQIKSRKGNSGAVCGKERKATHCRTTPSSGHCRFSESSSCPGKKKNVAESCCGNCCDTRESQAACCSNSQDIKCEKKVDACAGTESPKCAVDPCKKKRKYKKIWKNFKSVWSRRTRREIAIERSFRKVVRDQSVNTCSSNASLDYQYSFTECKMVTGILKHEKIAPEKSFSDIGCCTSSEVLPNYNTKSHESIRSSRSTGQDESVVTNKPVQEENKKAPAPAAVPQETKPSGGLFKKLGRKSSKDKNSDKDSKTAHSTPSSKNQVAKDKASKKEQNTKVTIKETPSQSKSLHTKNPSQAVNKAVGTNDVEREKSKQNINVKEVSDGCQPKSHVMECKDFVICQCSKGSKHKLKHSSCGQDSCS